MFRTVAVLILGPIMSLAVDRILLPASIMSMAVVSRVLLIACANLAGFFVAPAIDGCKEIARRLALETRRISVRHDSPSGRRMAAASLYALPAHLRDLRGWRLIPTSISTVPSSDVAVKRTSASISHESVWRASQRSVKALWSEEPRALDR